MSASERLPKDPMERTIALLDRSLPGIRIALPACLPAEAAEYIMQARNERATMYASAEDLRDRYRTLAEDMEETGVVMHLVDVHDEDSLVDHIDDVRRSLAEPEEIPDDGRR